MLEKILMGILITMGVIMVGLLVVVIVLACQGATIDAEAAWSVNPANPASPVHQLLF